MSKPKAALKLDPTLTEQGGVDGVKGGVLYGWYYSGDKPSDIEMLLHGDVYARTSSGVLRRTHSDNNVADLHVGFEFDVSAVPLNEVNEFSFRCIDTGFDFAAKTIRYCPLVNRYRPRLRNLFFAEYYKNSYELWGLTNREAFNHYASTGIYYDYDPNPWFSSRYYRENFAHKLKNIPIPVLSYIQFEPALDVRPSGSFDTRYYSANNPDLGANAACLEHYVRHGHREGRAPVARTLPATILRELTYLAEIEPALHDFMDAERRVFQYPILSGSCYLPRLIEMNSPADVAVIICVPFLSYGGAGLTALSLLKAYQQAVGKDRVLLLVTDRSENSVPSWMERGTRVIYLDDETSFTSFEERVRTLHDIIGQCNPSLVMNVNSHAAWEVYARFGKQLSSVTKLMAFVFCYDYTVEGRPGGYLKDYFARTLRHLKVVFADNQRIIDELCGLYGFTKTEQAKLHALYMPTPKLRGRSLERGTSSSGRPTVLWAGRLARQKRPELLIEIAETLPSFDFVVYGPPGDSWVASAIVEGQLDNITYEGVFTQSRDLDLERFELFLNTSAWDGLPNMLTQMMSLGLPIVSSNVGGISELVNDRTGWLVEEHTDPQAYAETLKRALINERERTARARRGRALVRKRHSWDTFYSHLRSFGALDIAEACDGGEAESAPRLPSSAEVVSIVDERIGPCVDAGA